MGINRSGTAIGVSVFIVVICTLDVQSTDLLFAVDGNGESSRIYTARSNGNSFSNSPLVPLNISGLSSPIGIDYDYRNDIIYWTDQNTHTISRATLNGSFQEIIASSSSTPHGIVLDLEKDKVFWLAAIGGKLESAHLNGSQHVDIVAGLSVPRGITISYTRRKLFFTTVGLIPGIQTVDTDGSNPTVLVDKDVGQPSGITFDFTEQRLYWTDASLDIIVSMDPDNSADRTSIISVNPDSGVDLFPFGIAVHNEDIYFSDIISQRIYFINGSSGSLSALDEVIPLAAEIHIYTDVCNNRCQNGGICVRSFASLRCLCPFGFGGTECEFEWCAERCVNGGTCISYEDGAVCSCTQGYSGARCETRTRYPSLLFICDEEAGAIYESSADELVFHRLPFRDLRRPVAVTYSPDDDMVFWIDAELLTINSAFRNGSDPKVLHSGLRYKDLAVHILTKSLVWIAEESLGFYGTHYPWDIVYSYANIYPRNLSAVTVNPSGGFYFTEWPSGILGVNAVFNVVVEQVIPAFVSPSSVTFDRLGNRLFIVDDAKNIIESFDAFGGDHDVIVHSNNTHPVDVAWYRGSPIWTDDFNKAIGFINVDRGLTYSITNRQHFMTPAGIHVFPGKSYIRIQGMGCMADEFSCNDSLCIPLSWRCDGIHDCSSSEDERDCKNDVPDASLLLVTDIDASAIYMATTNNLSFTRLPFEDVGSPVAVDFDPVEGFVFWTDVDAGRINAAKIDGTNQMLIVQGLGTPDGLFVDVQNRTLYWTDTFFNIIEAIHFSGSYRRTLVRALDEPRAIIILQSTRMLYWTDWGASPKIEMSNLSGQKRQTIVDTELGWPNGITTNAEETRIFWCDALLDKIESSDIYGKDRKLLLDVRHGTIHPFDIVWHMGSLMWTDWGLHGIGVDDAEEGRWPPNFLVTHRFSRPGGFHLYDDVCDPNPCTNNAFCIRDDFSHKYTCLCLDGWYGDNCGYGYCEENPNPCQSGGSCTSQQTAPFYMCSCAQGYFGSICENDACDPNPCLNGGSCNGDVSTDRYTCHCADGWNGQNCSNYLCKDRCQNGGMCLPIPGGATCSCAPAYTGETCEEEYDPCDHPNDCLGIRICVSNMGSYECLCPPGYMLSSSNTCQDIDECRHSQQNSCHQEGHCLNVPGSYRCTCRVGYTGNGTYCKVVLNPCISSPCCNGDCTNPMDGIYVCQCSEQYEGTNCCIEKSTTEPIKVLTHPESQTEVSPFQRVEFTCSFANAEMFVWQKNNISIARTKNQNAFHILSMTPADIGYYRCFGIGKDGSAATNQAAVYMKDLTNVVVADLILGITVHSPQDLNNISSETFLNTTSVINTYMITSLQNRNGFTNSPSVVSSNLRLGSIIADLNIYLTDMNTSALRHQELVHQTLQELANSPSAISLDVSQVVVTSTSICYNSTWTSQFGEVSFGQGELNSWANSTKQCPFNTTNAYQPIALAKCVGDRISEAKWQPKENCGPIRNVTDLLKEIQMNSVTEETVREVSKMVSIITENTEEITSEDVSIISDLAVNIVNQNSGDTQVTKEVTTIVSNIASLSTSQLTAAEEEDNSISNITQAFELQLNNVELNEGETLQIAEENVIVQITSITSTAFGEGLVLFLTGDSESDFTESQISVNMSDRFSPINDDQLITAEVNLPTDISTIVSDSTHRNKSTDDIRVIMVVFATPALFISPTVQNFSDNNVFVNRTANTPVIALSIQGTKIVNLTQTINMTFVALEDDYTNQTCVFWDTSAKDWSQKGCELVAFDDPYQRTPNEDTGYGDSTSESSVGDTVERYTCACDHLTNFAILMDVHAHQEPEYAFWLLTFIGSALSIFSLVLALATYISNKNLRSRQSNQIFICLCTTMLGLYVTFVVMLSLDNTRGVHEVAPGPCGLLAGLVHFFVLSSITWMGVEGVNTYLIIVRIFNSYIPNFMIKAVVTAWVIPGLIVILTGAIANTSYSRGDICFLKLWSQVGGLLIPMAVILTANVIIFFLVIRQLVLSAKIGGKVSKDKCSERRESVERIQNAVTFLVLLGLTWISGYLLLIKALSTIAQACFIIFNSFQGLFVFLLYCVRKPVVRDQWRGVCSLWRRNVRSMRRGSRDGTASSSVPSSPVTSFPTGSTNIGRANVSELISNPDAEVVGLESSVHPIYDTII